MTQEVVFMRPLAVLARRHPFQQLSGKLSHFNSHLRLFLQVAPLYDLQHGGILSSTSTRSPFI